MEGCRPTEQFLQRTWQGPAGERLWKLPFINIITCQAHVIFKTVQEWVLL